MQVAFVKLHFPPPKLISNKGEYRAIRINKTTELDVADCNGLRHGFGLRVYSNGSRYQGQWVNDKMEGHGEFTQVAGGKYEGEFFNGFR